MPTWLSKSLGKNVSVTFVAAKPVLVIADPKFMIDADVDWSDIVFVLL